MRFDEGDTRREEDSPSNLDGRLELRVAFSNGADQTIHPQVEQMRRDVQFVRSVGGRDSLNPDARGL
jgi:hypothetical protein